MNTKYIILVGPMFSGRKKIAEKIINDFKDYSFHIVPSYVTTTNEIYMNLPNTKYIEFSKFLKNIWDGTFIETGYIDKIIPIATSLEDIKENKINILFLDSERTNILYDYLKSNDKIKDTFVIIMDYVNIDKSLIKAAQFMFDNHNLTTWSMKSIADNIEIDRDYYFNEGLEEFDNTIEIKFYELRLQVLLKEFLKQ